MKGVIKKRNLFKKCLDQCLFCMFFIYISLILLWLYVFYLYYFNSRYRKYWSTDISVAIFSLLGIESFRYIVIPNIDTFRCKDVTEGNVTKINLKVLINDNIVPALYLQEIQLEIEPLKTNRTSRIIVRNH